MRIALILGVLLVLLGVAALVFGGVTYTTTQTAVQVGPVGITTKEKKTLSVPPVVGGLILAGGIALLIAGSMRR